MRSKSYLFLLVVIVLGALSAFGFYKLKFKKGLDIDGGVRLTYQLDFSHLTGERAKETHAAIQDQIIQVLINRAAGLAGVSEPSISAKGDDQVVAELPAVKDRDEAAAVMGESASIRFYWAKNVITEKNQNRPYVDMEEKTPGKIGVDFTEKIGAGKTITPKDPEYAQIIAGWGDPILSGDDLANARPSLVGNNYDPLLTFTPKGSQAMQAWSKAHYNQGEKLAAVLDGKVLSIAPVKDNEVLSDNAQIEGSFPEGYTSQLCDLLNSGALPVDLIPIGSQQVDPTIGADGFQRIVEAGLGAFVVISLFLIVYYAFPGFIAFLALSLYVLFTLTVLKLIGTTFSLAGIAGFILSVGMAVDANILVFERFKEEMKAGKTLSSAIQLGFKRALPAIIDSNACTIITSLVLANLGTGPVKGFANTLIIGVIISLFTAVTVTRSLLMFFVGSGIATNPKLYAVNRNWFRRHVDGADAKPLQVVNKSMLWFGISGFTILICIPAFLAGGFRLNVELKGGVQSSYSVTDNSLTAEQIEKNLESKGFRGGNVQFANIDATATAPAHREVDITLLSASNLTGTDAQKKDEIANAAGLSGAQNLGFESVGPVLQAETARNAVLGVIGSSLLIILYLGFRFGTGFGGFVAGLRFGLSAIGALIHDILVVFGTAAIVGLLFHWEVGALFLTAMLTIIGFSVHDTIVIFDRIRENLHKSKKEEDFGDLINRSITQSFARSINTSMTVIVTLFILVVVGTATNDLKFFVTSMLIGIVSGTYSSIYNASPILYLWDRAIARKRGPEHSLVGMVAAERARNRVIITNAATQQAANVPTSTQTGRTYGQVRRRANAQTQGIDIED